MNTSGSTIISGSLSGYRRRPLESVQGSSRAAVAIAAAPSSVHSSSMSVACRRPGRVFASRSLAAAMCCGRVPQQPPTMSAPSSRHCSASSANSGPPMRRSNAQPDSV